MTSALPPAPPSQSEATVIGNSPEMERLSKLLELLPSKARTPVLILGESGAGKRHFATALHRNTYPQGEFVVLEYSRALTQLAKLFGESEVLREGQNPGGKTLYIHEITEAPSEVQARVLQLFHDLTGGPNAIRLVASSSRDLVRAARDGFLRHELAYRFPVVLQLPPLRERARDIPELVALFSRTIAHRFGGNEVTFSPEAIERLVEYDWPGNVGELYNLVERSVLFADRTELDVEDLPQLSSPRSGIDFRLPPTGISLSDLEREVLVQALRITDNNQTHAAGLLGLTRDQIRYRMAKFGIASRDSSVPPPPVRQHCAPRSRKQSLNSSG
jgi:two-component system, NtrC family, response regulator AtoC